MKYSNPTWEPYFKDIAPILSKLYFMTNSGTIKYIVATMIFKKMSFLEWRNEERFGFAKEGDNSEQE